MRLVEPTPEESAAGFILGLLAFLAFSLTVNPYLLLILPAMTVIGAIGHLGWHAGKYVWRCLKED